jgi:hypothetical protein
MVSGPTEILVRDPCPAVIGVSPVAIGVGTPIGIVHRYVGLPAVSVTFNFDPVSTGNIIVKEINRYVGSPHLLESRRTKSKNG